MEQWVRHKERIGEKIAVSHDGGRTDRTRKLTGVGDDGKVKVTGFGA